MASMETRFYLQKPATLLENQSSTVFRITYFSCFPLLANIFLSCEQNETFEDIFNRGSICVCIYSVYI